MIPTHTPKIVFFMKKNYIQVSLPWTNREVMPQRPSSIIKRRKILIFKLMTGGGGQIGAGKVFN